VPTSVLEPDGGFADTIRMFLRSKTRTKDGKEHRYWSVVENRRVADGRVVQRHVLYLGEINDAQRAAWCRSIAVFDEDAGAATQLALFPEDRVAPELACAVVQVKLSELQLCDRHASRLVGASPTVALGRREHVGEGKGARRNSPRTLRKRRMARRLPDGSQ
jgi:hypothetical protein